MSLFQKSVISKYLKSQNKETISAKWESYQTHFLNLKVQEEIKSLKEEQYQGEFLEDLFVKILGYTKPASSTETKYNLTTEYKNVKDSKKADGAIIIDDKVKAVIELKGTNTTDLGKIEAQAFGYKNNQPECVYVITSNFEKLRFYIDNAIEHLEFNLFTLTEEEFLLLYLCLGFENISNDIAKKIKEESLSQEDVITKKLYKDYSLFKRELHQSLVVLNPDYEPLELFKKSQKLLDRFLFLFFGEDRSLLPPNSIKQILSQWNQLRDLDEYTPLYDRFKKYFGYLNTGFKGKQYDVFAYNGGLFKSDEILDNIIIDDDLLYKHTVKLSEYDFASEVDVNILGHIFENSLNELDEIKAQLEGAEIDKSKTKRKKDGVFYTPKYITKYIVENTVGKLCDEKKLELKLNEEDYTTDKKRTKATKQPLLDKLTQYRNWLLQITICDSACGSGAFLNEALNFLIAEHTFVDELQAKLFGDAMVLSDVEKSILENNLFGVDLNEESVEIAKLSLWLRTAQPNRKLNDLNNNIKCGNSLIDDPEIAGDKAFNWQNEFPKIFKEKNKKTWHITTAIHDSRTSQRMIDYKVREKRAMGTMPEPQIHYLTDDDEMVIAETVALLTKELHLNILAFNVCKDHIHIVLVCDEEELDEIVRKLKGRTAREVNKSRENRDTDTTMGSTMGLSPLPLPLSSTLPVKNIPLWTQKFGCKEILDEAQLENTINYVKNNRNKHNLPPNNNKGFKPHVDSIASDYEYAYRKEYKGGFDVVIGNPPYGATLNENDVQYFRKKYSTVIGHSEVYYLFTEKAINDLVKSGSYIGYIIPNAWLSNKYARKLRELLIEETRIEKLINFNKKIIFEDANVETAIFISKKIKPKDTDISLVGQDLEFSYDFKQSEWKSNNDYLISFASNNKIDIILKKVNSTEFRLAEKLDISNGFKPYQVGYGINIDGEPLNSNDVTNKIYHSNILLDNTYKKEIKGKGVKRYSFQWEENYIKWGKWLMSPKSEHYFEQPKILVRQVISDYLFAYLDCEKYYADQSLYVCTNFKGQNERLEFYTSLLNSKLYGFFFRKFYSEEDDLFPKIKVNELKNLPIKESNEDFKVQLSEFSILFNKLIMELQEQSQKFQRTLQRKFFDIDNNSIANKGFKPLVATEIVLPKKLQDWYLLSYADFIKELAKKKVKLSLSQEAEWEDYFMQESKKALELKSQIDATDKAIDKMVYELYGLTEEEIAIVEKS